MTMVIDNPESKSPKFKPKAKSQIQNESILHPQLSPEAQRYDLSVSLGSALVRVGQGVKWSGKVQVNKWTRNLKLSLSLIGV